MSIQKSHAHCRAGSRPGEVWLALILLGDKYALADDILCTIHKKVGLSSPAEKEGLENALAKIEREKQSRREAGAEKAVPRWRLLNFSSLRAYLMQLRAERRAEAERDMPDWLKFGFATPEKYKRACQRVGVWRAI